MTRWTSAEIRPFVVEVVASHEAIIAEGRCTAWIPANFWTVANNPAYLVNNPVYIVVTKSRLLGSVRFSFLRLATHAAA